jgi:hypothetical protein
LDCLGPRAGPPDLLVSTRYVGVAGGITPHQPSAAVRPATALESEIARARGQDSAGSGGVETDHDQTVFLRDADVEAAVRVGRRR